VIRLAAAAVHNWDEPMLRYIKQLGVDEVVIHTPDLPGAADGRWDYLGLVQLRSAVENAGLKIAAIENVPKSFYLKAVLGQPGRDEQIENYLSLVRNVGKAGIPILGLNFHPITVWRTSRTTPGRGGAHVTSFDYDLVKNAPLQYGREITEDEMWANWTYFAKAVMPVAEAAGIKLALHPDDPPMPTLGGAAQLMVSFANFKRALEIADSDSLGLDFCQGCWAEMGGPLDEYIRYFASRGKILYVHFRNVRGTVPKFDETFINDGDVDMFAALKTYKECGFDGFIVDDHVPRIVDDTPWGHRSRAYAMGYIQSMLDIVNKQ
jgi:mannonate dehydratase